MKDTNDIIARMKQRANAIISYKLGSENSPDAVQVSLAQDVLALATRLSRYAELEGALKGEEDPRLWGLTATEQLVMWARESAPVYGDDPQATMSLISEVETMCERLRAALASLTSAGGGG